MVGVAHADIVENTPIEVRRVTRELSIKYISKSGENQNIFGFACYTPLKINNSYHFVDLFLLRNLSSSSMNDCRQ